MPPKPRPPAFRFWPKVNQDGPLPERRPDLGPCWLWTAHTNHLGYGRFRVGATMVQAHRFAYEELVGPIPEGLELDHLCRNRTCVNPFHCEPVTERVNVLRGDTLPAANVLKTHCPQGHEYTPENTRLGPTGKRYCRACTREWVRQYYRRQRAAALACSS